MRRPLSPGTRALFTALRSKVVTLIRPVEVRGGIRPLAHPSWVVRSENGAEFIAEPHELQPLPSVMSDPVA